MKRFLLFLLLILNSFVFVIGQNKFKTKQSFNKENYLAYLFAYFTGNDNDAEAIRFVFTRNFTIDLFSYKQSLEKSCSTNCFG